MYCEVKMKWESGARHRIPFLLTGENEHTILSQMIKDDLRFEFYYEYIKKNTALLELHTLFHIFS